MFPERVRVPMTGTSPPYALSMAVWEACISRVNARKTPAKLERLNHWAIFLHDPSGRRADRPRNMLLFTSRSLASAPMSVAEGIVGGRAIPSSSA